MDNESKTKKYVICLQLHIYTDGKFYIEIPDYKHQSQYFEQSLYEYTFCDTDDNHTFKIRRVFDFNSKGLAELDKYVKMIASSIDSHSDYTKEQLTGLFKEVGDFVQSFNGRIAKTIQEIENKVRCHYEEQYEYSYNVTNTSYDIDVDSNYELDGFVSVFECKAQKIDRIIYKED